MRDIPDNFGVKGRQMFSRGGREIIIPMDMNITYNLMILQELRQVTQAFHGNQAVDVYFTMPIVKYRDTIFLQIISQSVIIVIEISV